MALFKPSAPKAGRGTRVSLLVALVVVGVVVGIYVLYVRAKTGYYIERNLRVLSSLSEQLDGAFVQQETFVRNYARATNWPRAELPKLLADFDSADCESEAFPGASKLTPTTLGAKLKTMPGAQASNLELRERNGVYWLQVAWAGEIERPDRTPLKQIKDYREPETQRTAAAHCKQIAVDKILRPLLNNERFGAFDAVFIANTKGKVLYSMAPPHAASTLLLASVAQDEKPHTGAVTTPTLAMADLRSMGELTGWLGRETTAIDPEGLRQVSRHTDVDISGDRYLLFTQPYCFRHPSDTPTATPASAETKMGFATPRNDADNAGEAWIVGGLVSAERFHADARSISASKVALAIVLCVLFVCAWPFLRISLLTERQPLAVTDVALLAICSVVGVILLTLTLLDAVAYERLNTQTDAQLGSFAYRLEYDFTRNVIRASNALDDIQAWSLKHHWTANNESGYLHRALAGDDPEKFYAEAVGKDHGIWRSWPYFTAFSWIDSAGMQRYKVAAKERLPLVSVADRQYFQTALARQTWDAHPMPDGSERYPYSLEWVQSKTTGKTQALIAKNTGMAALPVVSLTTHLIDVNETMPPPGVSFAIIDEQGHVIYHPDEQRIGREDFFAETDFNRELRGAVLSRSDAYVTSSYWGEDQRMFVHPLRNTQWTLVAFRGKRLLRAINVEALLMTLLALLSNALPYLLLGGLVMAIAPWYRAPSLWPDVTNEKAYARLASVMGLAAVSLALSIYAIAPENMAMIIVLLPAQAMLSGYMLLHRHNRRRRMMFVALIGWIVTTTLLLWVIASAHVDSDLLISAKPARTRWLLIAVIVFESLVAIKMFARGETEQRRSNSSSTTLETVVCWLLITAVAGVAVWHIPTAFRKDDDGYSVGLRLLYELMLILASVMIFQYFVASDKATERRESIRKSVSTTFAPAWARLVAIWLPNAAAVFMMSFVLSRQQLIDVGVLTGTQALLGTLLLLRNAALRKPGESESTEEEESEEEESADEPVADDPVMDAPVVDALLVAYRVIWAPVALTLLAYVTVRTAWLPRATAWWAETAVPVVFFVTLVTTVVLADGRAFVAAARRVHRLAPSLRYPTSYRLAGLLTLLVGAALPALAFFKLGSRVEQEAIVKFAQLRMAGNIEHRINTIGSLICNDDKGAPDCLGGVAAETAKRDAFGYHLPQVWDTLWSFEQKPRRTAFGARRAIPYEFLMPMIPHYSEDSVAMRQLYAKDLADPLWQWPPTLDSKGRLQPNGRMLTLDRRIRLEAAAAAALWPRKKSDPMEMRHHSLRLTSFIPLLFPSKWSYENERRFVSSPLSLMRGNAGGGGVSDFAYTTICLLLLAGFGGVLYWIVRFITDRVLLVDVYDPSWIKINNSAAVGGNIFVVRREIDARNKLLPPASEVAFDVSFEQLQTAAQWDASLKSIDGATGRQVRVSDFEFGFNDPKVDPNVNLTKLAWLEKVLARGDRTILIVSTISPAYVIGGTESPKVAQRWEKLLAQFLPLTWEDIEFRRICQDKLKYEGERAQNRQWTVRSALYVIRNWQQRVKRERRRKETAWLRDETANSPVLRRLARQIDTVDLSREQILDELRERADGYYQSLWSSCTPDEKLLLFHLARHGFINPKNRRLLRRLIARGLVRRSPNLELLSETFRLHVLAAGCSEDMPAMVRNLESEGAWRTLRVPLFIVVTSFLLLLFTTQKDLLTLTTGFAAAITTGLPVLVNLFGMFTQRRLDTAAKTL